MNKKELDLFKHCYNIEQCKEIYFNFLYQMYVAKKELDRLCLSKYKHVPYVKDLNYYSKMFNKYLWYGVSWRNIVKRAYSIDLFDYARSGADVSYKDYILNILSKYND